MPSLRDLAARRLVSILRRDGKLRFGVERLESRDNPAPVQFFYLPMPETQTHAGFDAIVDESISATVESLTAITVTENNTRIWYDHWEDGYEAILGTPLQATTQLWGDGNDANGIAPGFANDPNGLPSGTVLRLRNTVNTPRNTTTQPILWDSPDKFGSDRTLAVSRAQFPTTVNSGGGSVISSAVEVRDTRYYDTAFTAPVGVNTANAGNMFTYAAFFVQAAYDGTRVQIDANNDGDFTDPDDRDVVLNQGQTVVSGQNVQAGGRVVASKRVQADLMTGEINANFASRTYALFSNAQLANDYFTPVGFGGTGDDANEDDVRLFVYNPNGASIDVVQENDAGTVTTKTIAAGAGDFFDVGYDAGTRLYTTGLETFIAVGVHDGPAAGSATTHDWGFSLQPVPALSTVAIVGLGVGNSSDPPAGDGNTSPIYATVLGNTTLFVDHNNDGTVDQTIALSRLQTVRLRDTTDNDDDNSGMRLYTTDGTLISVTWGEDGTAPAGSPGFDAGSTVPAVAVPEFYKFVDFAPAGDVNGDGLFNSGDRLRYTLRVRNIGAQPVNTAVLTDALPAAFVTYVANSTTADVGSGVGVVPDDGSGTAFPLDGAGYNITTIAVGGVIVVTFDVTINPGLPVGTSTITNTANLAYDIFNLPALADVSLRGTIGDTVYRDDDGNGTQSGGEPGVSGVTVRLLRDNNNDGLIDGGDTVIGTLTTDANGRYRFTDLFSGDYLVDVTDAAGRLAGSTLTGGTDPRDVTLADGEVMDTADFGYRGTGSIGQRVFIDTNGNGTYEAGEGRSGVTVRVSGDMDGDGTVTAGETVTVTTGANGLYSFNNLWVAGGVSYTVVVDPTTLPGGLTNTIDPDGGTANQSSLTLTPAAPTNTGQNFGYRGPGTIGDRIFLDQNGNGTYEAGEGLGGVQVTVSGDFDGNGTVDAGETLTATTDTNGFYQFAGLRTPAGGLPYTIVVVPGTLPRDSAGNPLANSTDPDGGTANQSVVTLTAAAPTSDTQDFGYRGDGSIGDQIFLDVNNNGTADAGEGIAGVRVRVIGDVDGNGIAQTFTVTTDTSGNYTFGGLPVRDAAGNLITYTVAVDPTTVPTGLTNNTDPDGGTANQASGDLGTNPTRTDFDFGYRGAGSVGSTVWLDVNGNNAFDAGEGIANVRVVLTGDLDGDGDTESATATTDTNGQYLFGGLRTTAGGVPYTVSVDATSLPTGVSQSFDPDGTLDGTAVATLTTATPSDLTRSFAYRGPGSIGDRVFNDINNNGVYDAGEGLDGVVVTLTGDFDNDGVNETVSATTAGDGLYTFGGLVVDGDNGPGVTPKTYTLTVLNATLPATLTQTTDPDSTPDNQFASTLSPAAPTDLSGDFGYRGPGVIGSSVFLDVNNNGTPESGEGIAGVRVRLVGDFDGDGTAETVTTTTDSNGQYQFSGLRTTAGGVPYTVVVDPATLPASVTTTPTTDPQGPLDGSATATLTNAAPTNTSQNFGYRGPGGISGTAFLDVNTSGTPNAGEGLSGVRVRLTGDLDGDGDTDTVTTTTGAGGVYQFTGLRTTPGGVPYTVTVDATTLPQDGPGTPVPNTVDPDGGNDNTSTVPLTNANPTNSVQDYGYRNTSNGIIGDTVFLDVDGDGAADAGEGITGVRVAITADVLGNGTTQTFTATTDANGNYLFSNLPVRTPGGVLISYTVTVNPADLPTGVTNTVDPDGGNNGTSTLTLNPANPVDLSQRFGYRGSGSFGDRVFLDLNNTGLFDTGEGVTTAVVLSADVNGDGVQDLTLTVTTGSDGEYQFGNLPVNDRNGTPINYTVRVPAAGLPSSVANTADPDGTTDGAWTGTLATGPGAPNRTDIDFGYRGTAALGNRVWLDANGNGVQDPTATEPGLPNVGLTLTHAGQDGVFGTDDDITTTTTADATGVYGFNGLPAGTVRVTVNTATLPTNASPTFDLNGIITPHTADATLTDGESRADVNFGYRGSAVLGNRVWIDGNRNGTQDPGEGGIPGAVVELRLSGPDGLVGTADDFRLTTTTGANGGYLFEGLPVYLPGGDPFRATVLSLPAPAVTPVSDSDSPVGTGDGTAAGTVAGSQTRSDVNFGYAGTAAISGIVFDDRNNDGERQPGEPGIAGTVLVLEGADVYGNPVRDPLTGGPLSTTVDAAGNYSFGDLPAGVYTVREAQPAGYLDGTDTPGSLGGVADADRITQITLSAGQTSVNNRFAELSPSAVTGTVFEDRNNNGRQDPSEPGIPGVRVVLSGTDDRGPVAVTLTTDANGNYRFPDLRPGTYTLTQTQPAGFNQGQNAVGTAGGTLGDTDVIRSITLAPGLSAIEYRFGELVRQLSATPALSVEPVQPWEASKRMFLSSTSSVRTASVPDFSALGSVNTTRPVQFAATGDGDGGSRVRVYDLTNGRERFRFNPFPGFTGGVRTAVGDVTGDGIPDVVAAAGPGGGPHVVIYNGDTGAVVQSFYAFEEAFRGGSMVAVGDFDGDGRADLAVGADSGGGPRVRVFRSGNPAWVMSDFWGIEDMNFRGGARVAAGDINGDGRTDLVVGAGAGGGPRIAVYDGRGVAVGNPFKVVGDFFAFEPSFTGGVYLAAADVDGDGYAEVITGAGEGGGPRVRTASGRELTAGRVTTVSDQFVFDADGNSGGARVAATDLDGDGRAELFLGTGPGVRPLARFYNPRTGAGLNTFSPNWENEAGSVFVG